MKFKVIILAILMTVIMGSSVAEAMTPRFRDYRVCRIDLLMQAVSHGTWILTTNQPIPDGVDYLGPVSFDADGCIIVRLRDRSWDLVPDGQNPPLINWEWSGLQPPTTAYQQAYTKGMAQSGVPVPQCPTRFIPYHPPVSPVPVATPRSGIPVK